MGRSQPAGKRKGAAVTIKALEEWSRQSLTKQKWLRGGFKIVIEVHILIFHEEDIYVDNFELPDTQVTHGKSTKEDTARCT